MNDQQKRMMEQQFRKQTKERGNFIHARGEKQSHEGEIWRKQGPMDWCRIDRNETPEAKDYDGGLSGFAVRLGNFSIKKKRVYWGAMTYFVTADNYADFVEQMKGEWRYLMQGELKEQKNEL